MKQMSLLSATLLGAAIALTGCGGNSSSSSGGVSSPSLDGTAAIGAPMANATVEAICADGSGFTTAITTNAMGKWSGAINDANVLPCALKASDGANTHYSFATATGIVNITPLTTFALARATGQAPAAWFTSGSANVDGTALAQAADDIIGALNTGGYTMPPAGNPFTTPFVAGGNDPWDNLLDQIGEALDTAGNEGFLDDIISGNLNFPDAPESGNPPVDPPSSETLGNNNGITAIINGTRQTAFQFDSPYNGWPVSGATGYPTLSNDHVQFNLSGIHKTLNNVNGSCKASGLPSLSIELDGVWYNYNSEDESTSCSFQTDDSSETFIYVTFSGTLKNFDGDILVVTDGEFQYSLDTFKASDAQPQIFASFEGMDPAPDQYGEANLPVATGDRGWDKDWPFLDVHDTSANPLSFTLSDGAVLEGGERAVQLIQDAPLAKSFGEDVYIATLFRFDGDSPDPINTFSYSKLVMGNGSFYMGVEADELTFSVGDKPEEKATHDAVTKGETYLLVARLYKTPTASSYNQMDYWINPTKDASGSPTGTLSNSWPDGYLVFRFVNYVGTKDTGYGRPYFDRVVASSTWDGLFTE